jgi:plastocyanin
MANISAISQNQDVRVEIKKYTYSPNSITVPAGTTVIWKNLDPVQHTVTSTSGKFNSGIIDLSKDRKDLPSVR